MNDDGSCHAICNVHPEVTMPEVCTGRICLEGKVLTSEGLKLALRRGRNSIHVRSPTLMHPVPVNRRSHEWILICYLHMDDIAFISLMVCVQSIGWNVIYETCARSYMYM